MVNNCRLQAGCRVKGSHGPFIPNPNPNIKRRLRERVEGTVIKASGQREWIVCFDYDGKEKEVSSNALTIVSDAEAGIPLNEVRAEAETVSDESANGNVVGDENNVSWCFVFVLSL